MNSDAEAEIERLYHDMPAERGYFIEQALRAAMTWAYQDAARVCRQHAEQARNIGASGNFVAALLSGAAAIEARAKA